MSETEAQVAPSRRLIVVRARRRLGHAPAILLFAQTVHVAGDAAVAVALAQTLFFDVPVGEARTEVALYLGLAFAPYAVLASVATPVFARWRRAHGAVIVGSDVARTLLAALLISRLGGPLLYPLGFLLLVMSRLHSVSLRSLMPELVEPGEDLVAANASVSIVSGFAGLAGGGTALAVAGIAGPGPTLLLASTLFAAGSLVGLWLSPPGAPGRDAAPAPVSLGAGGVRRLAALVAGRTALGFTGMLIAFAFHGEGRSTLLLALGALALGTGVAPFAVRPARGLLDRGLTGLTVGLLAVAAVVTSLLDGLAAAAVLAGTVGFLGAVARIAFDAHVQEHLPGDVRGGAYARYETVLQLAWIAGASVGSLAKMPLSSGGYVVAGLGVATLAGTRLAHRVVGRARPRRRPAPPPKL